MEIEVSVFGPGFGESVVVHLGNRQWIVIDSCLDVGSGRSAPLEYLRSIGVEVSTQVKLVIATHWHDDHIFGISELFKAAKSATFVTSDAVHSAEFNRLLTTSMCSRSLPLGSGATEMERVFHELRIRRESGYLCPKLASAGKELWVQYAPDPIRVRALSPSDASIVTARARFAELASTVQEYRLRLPRLEPNDTSVTISVEFARSAELLFGADLEDRNVEGVGWRAVLSDWHPALGKHTVFKIAHHGSPNGHVQEIWEHLLDHEPYAVTTPFCQGSVRLPSRSDCERIASLTPNGYLTAPPKPKRFSDPNPAVVRTVNEVALNAALNPSFQGQVRLRRSGSNSNWTAQLFGHALTLKKWLDTASSA